MPELPRDMRARFIESYGLREYDADVLTANRPLATYYETVATTSGDPKTAAAWVTTELAGLLKSDAKDIADSPVKAEQLGELVALIGKGEISAKLAKEILPKMYATGDPAPVIMDREGLRQISDTGELEKIVRDVVAANPKQVEQYKGGKTTVIGFFVGQVMKATRGQANPAAVNDLLKKALD
jgi:aspartyl-tRNA(Asn)/glutamyl-tRNA(Gln) amidotransferase subunit B